MPIRQNLFTQVFETDNSVTISGVSAGTSNNRAIFVGMGFQDPGRGVITNATYAGSNNLTFFGEYGWDDTNTTSVTLSVWGAYGIASGSNDLVLNTFDTLGSASGSFVGVTFTDAETNGAIQVTHTEGLDVITNELASTNTRAALSFHVHRRTTAITRSGPGHVGLTNLLIAGNADSMTGLSTVDPATNAVEMTYNWSTQDAVFCWFDVQGPAPAAAPTNIAMVGIG